MENCPKGLKYALSGRMEIHPCVLQDIGFLGPLPCSHSTFSAIQAGHRVPLTMCDPWMTCFFYIYEPQLMGADVIKTPFKRHLNVASAYHLI